MNQLKTVCTALILFVANPIIAWTAGTLTPEQIEVRQFIEKMYSYDPITFEGGEFSQKDGSPFDRNRAPDHGGKYDPQRKCDLVKNFFEDSLVQKRIIRPGLIGCDAPDRYPFLSDENRSSETRYEEIPAPYIMPPVLSRDSARIEVFPAGNRKISNPPNFDLGRTLYFLTRTGGRWRITNVMIHTKWPDLDDGTHNCYFNFAKPPNEEEAREIPKHCRQ